MKVILNLKRPSPFCFFNGQTFELEKFCLNTKHVFLKETKANPSAENENYFRFTDVIIVDIKKEMETSIKKRQKRILEFLIMYCEVNNIYGVNIYDIANSNIK